MQPIFELEIANEIMYTLRKANLGFYQRELSYMHCEVANPLEEVSYYELAEEEKRKHRIESLPCCNGDYLVPILKKTRQANIIYASYVVQVLLQYYNTKYDKHSATIDGSLLEHLFAWIEQYTENYKKQEGIELSVAQLSILFTLKLQDLLDSMEKEKCLNKK